LVIPQDHYTVPQILHNKSPLHWHKTFAFGNTKLGYCGSGIHKGPPCQIQQLLTLNFQSYDFSLIGGFLVLFPVFTLTTNYPLISITLRNNIQVLGERVKFIKNWKYSSFCFSALAAVPPIILAFLTDNVSELVGVTGGLAGLFIQYTFPGLLVLFARIKMNQLLAEKEQAKLIPSIENESDNLLSKHNQKEKNQEKAVSSFSVNNDLNNDGINLNNDGVTNGSNSGGSEKNNLFKRIIEKLKKFYYLSRPIKNNVHSSPFKNVIWIIFVLVFSIIALVINLYSIVYCRVYPNSKQC
jgi:hypothetical protein